MEKVPKSTIPDIDKKKFLVPADLSGKLSVMLFPKVFAFPMLLTQQSCNCPKNVIMTSPNELVPYCH